MRDGVHFITRDPGTGLRRSHIRWPDGRPPTPDGCRWCGLPQRIHCQRWVASARWHGWTEPTDAQRLARIHARQRHAVDFVIGQFVAGQRAPKNTRKDTTRG